jgi:hypothetical protein
MTKADLEDKVEELEKRLVKAEGERDAAVERLKRVEDAKQDADAAKAVDVPAALRAKAEKCPFVAPRGIICPLIRR